MNAYFKKILTTTLVLIVVIVTAPLQSNAQHYAVVKGSDVNVRSGPDKSYSVEGVAKKGDTVTIISESKGWSQITTSKSVEGYIATSFLEKFGSDTSPIPPIKEKKSYWWLILLVIIILFLAGRWLQGKSRSASINKNKTTPQSKPVNTSPAPAQPQQLNLQTEPIVNKVSLTASTEFSVIEKEPEPVMVKPESIVEKEDFPSGSGDDFEDFIAAKIAGNPYLSLKHRRSDKIALEQRISAESGKYPDFDVVFKLQYDNETTEQAFAIECKWRRNLLNGSLQIDSWQIDHYKQYAVKENINVYLVIGYGGEAINPEKLYLVPLSEIIDGNMSAEFLKKFEHKSDEIFYYAPEKKELKLLPTH